jgi:hypothetical protein
LRRILNWHVLRLAFSSPVGHTRFPSESLGSRWSLGMPILVGSSLRLASKLLAAKAFCWPLPGAGGSVSEVGPRQVWRRTTYEKSPWLALHVETRWAMVLAVDIWSGAEARGGKNSKFQRGLVSGGGNRRLCTFAPLSVNGLGNALSERDALSEIDADLNIRPTRMAGALYV